MSKYPGALASLIGQKCPQCRSEKVFLHKIYSWNFLKMHRHCPNCNMDLEPEPGFYWGAMYISYGFNAALAIIVSLLLYFVFGNPDMWTYAVIIGVLSILLIPPFIRYSRTMLLYSVGGKKFDPSLFKKK